MDYFHKPFWSMYPILKCPMIYQNISKHPLIYRKHNKIIVLSIWHAIKFNYTYKILIKSIKWLNTKKIKNK